MGSGNAHIRRMTSAYKDNRRMRHYPMSSLAFGLETVAAEYPITMGGVGTSILVAFEGDNDRMY